MTLQLFDTATQATRPFKPLVPGQVSMYVCGATVQAPPHMGHMRSGVAFDILHRWLIETGNEVTFIRNVTDIDDKILARAATTHGEEWWAIATTIEREFQDAYRRLNCLPPTIEPRATGHILDMITLTERLIAVGAAYARNGNVYFSVARARDYGALSGQDPAKLRETPPSTTQERQPPRSAQSDEGKNDPRDFALWKATRPGEPATASWLTPWGRARPGWHLECSAMSTRYLGPTFDIHGGGRDLIFPHHENERAQSRTAGDGFARYWLHNAWVTMGGEKMSKSLNNSLPVRELLATWGPTELRYWLLSGHYRSTLEYSPDALRDAKSASDRVLRFVTAGQQRVRGRNASAATSAQTLPEQSTRGTATPGSAMRTSPWGRRFSEALDDDLNTSEALAAMHHAVHDGNTALSSNDDRETERALEAVTWMTDILGLAAAPRTASNDVLAHSTTALLGLLIRQRDAARQRRDYEEADRIRDELANLDISLSDTPEGTNWRIR